MLVKNFEQGRAGLGEWVVCARLAVNTRKEGRGRGRKNGVLAVTWMI